MSSSPPRPGGDEKGAATVLAAADETGPAPPPPPAAPPPPPYSAFGRGERRVIAGLVATASWFSTLSSFVYYPALGAVATDLGTTPARVHLTVTAYLALAAVAPAVVGDAADARGRRPLYAATLALYVAANVGIALQRSFAALLLLRMLQSAGISGTFSIAYGVLADIAAPAERGAFVAALACGTTTAPSLGPVVGGALAAGPGWRAIFWLLAAGAALCLAAMALCLPETNRDLVGNGDRSPPRRWYYRTPPWAGRGAFMRPWARQKQQQQQQPRPQPNDAASSPRYCGPRLPSPPPPPRRYPNPLRSLRVLARRDVAVSVLPGSLLYTVYSCIHVSLATTFLPAYRLDALRAGFVYLPFGAGCLAATLAAGRCIDRDYRAVARAHGLPVTRAGAAPEDRLRFPVEEARLRGALPPTAAALVAVVLYGWLVELRVHMAAPLACLFVAGFSIQMCFNINNTLLVDINEDMPATAQAACNLVRCLLAAVAVAVLQDAIDALGFGWAFTVLGALCFFAGVFFLVERSYGWHWRLARHGASPRSS